MLTQACTASRPPASDPENLHQRIRSGTAVKTGERVRITTRDGGTLLLTVTSVTPDNLSGNQVVYLPAAITWGDNANLQADPDPSTTVTIPVEGIDSIVDQATHENSKPSHAAKALLLAAYGFLIVFAWTLP